MPKSGRPNPRAEAEVTVIFTESFRDTHEGFSGPLYNAGEVVILPAGAAAVLIAKGKAK